MKSWRPGGRLQRHGRRTAQLANPRVLMIEEREQFGAEDIAEQEQAQIVDPVRHAAVTGERLEIERVSPAAAPG